MSTVRHHFVMQYGIDPSYDSYENPLKRSDRILREGRSLYVQHCSSCHGATGQGDSETGKNLNPPPPNIAATSKMPMATDEYLYWTIAEGGVPLGTAMPPFKSFLKEDDIWKLVIYLRSL